jgi:hypothetical protein
LQGAHDFPNQLLPPDEQRVLVTELAEAVLGQAAPEEFVVFDETAAEFFQPRRRL